jgi:transforming growth factor-beta-induced protein
MKKIIFNLFLMAFASAALVSCNKDDNTTPTPTPTPATQNIVEIAQSNGFDRLAEAVVRAGLVDDLSGTTELTVFAPTNEAFDALLETIGQESIQDVPVSVLQQVLLYHVVAGSVMSTDISAGGVTTLQGSDITLSVSNGIMVNDASVQAPFDVEATNGVVHTIDEVLVPAGVAQFVNTVLEPAYFNNNFTTLIAAAAKAGLVETLLTTENLTIFAPANDAFTAAGIVVEDTDVPTLTAVLTYHVIGAKVMSNGIPREGTTLNGANLYFSLTESGAYINGNTMITAVDIESGSGVVHVIDQVLLPPTGNLVETAVALSEGGEFTALVAALTRTANEGTAEQNLITVLSGDGPFTVFAPTDEAFQNLLDSNADWNSLSDIPLETLIAVLTYHVVPARAYDKDLASALQNGELPTANGQNISIDLATLTINSNSNITGVNTNATNGVIHVINSVLLPSKSGDNSEISQIRNEFDNRR